MRRERYISKHGASELKSYIYASSDASIVYHAFASPFAEYLVSKMPRTISPNMMSLTGFCCVLTFYSISLGFYYDTNPLPSWLLFLSSFLFFCYSTIDNMDGKQARRTGASSPLGLIFDHQVDSFATVMIAAFLSTMLGHNGTDSVMLMWFAFCTPFYLATWEEYQLGRFNLSLINGADEGTMLGYTITLLAGIFGPQIYTNPRDILYGYSAEYVLLRLLVCFTIFVFFQHLYSVVSKPNKGDVWDSLKGYLRLFVAWLVIRFFSPANMALENHVALGACYAFLYSKETAMVQLAHVTNGLHRSSKINGRFVEALMIHTLLAYYGMNPVSEVMFLYVVTFLAFVNYAYTVTCGAMEIAEILDIPIFAMPKLKAKDRSDSVHS